MGRPYTTELARLADTYAWALELDIGTLTTAIRRAATTPLVTVGSGGSFTAAHFCAASHERATGQLARAMTPLEVVSLGGTARGAAVALFSAGGKNADIRSAFHCAVASEPPACWVVTATSESPLADATRMAQSPALLAHEAPAGRDGFLATNSLLQFCMLTHQAYAYAFRREERLPPSWDQLAEDGPHVIGAMDELWEAETLVVLHGYTTRAAAMDLESKSTEAGLAQVQLADFRNFGHGRHHWLAKHGKSAVLAIMAPEDAKLARRTLELLPRSIACARLEVPHGGMVGGLRAVIDVMRLVGSAGAARGIDPGRPGVPAFGSKLYSLRAIHQTAPRRAPGASGGGIVAVERKTRRPFDSLSIEERNYWNAAYLEARARLETTVFSGVVFDYDGTLVDEDERFEGPRPEVARALLHLLDAGARIGIATGRGRSAGEDLRRSIPQRHWSRVLVGYYNGGEIRVLSDTAAPDRRTTVRPSLRRALKALRASEAIKRLATITPRRSQITIEARDPLHADELWGAAQGALLRARTDVRLVRSSHSLDALARGVTKLSLVTAVACASSRASARPVLRIGDRGVWPGNDAELLGSLDGLSVYEVSQDPGAAWNLAPAGARGVRATLAYCAALVVRTNGAVRLPNVDAIGHALRKHELLERV